MKIRLLQKNDYEQYISLIDEFRPTTFTSQVFTEILNSKPHTMDIWVLHSGMELVATGTIIYEQKFIYNLAKIGHIEDVCVSKNHRKKGYGKMLIEHMLHQSKKHGCYKTILNCSDDNCAFYEKCGLKPRGMCMSILHKDPLDS